MEISEASNVNETGEYCQPVESNSTTFTSFPSVASLTDINMDFPKAKEFNKNSGAKDFNQSDNSKMKRVISSFVKMILNSLGVSDECCSSEHINEYMDCLEPKALESFYGACKVYFDPNNNNSGVVSLKTINQVSENISTIYDQLTKLQSSIQAVAPKFNAVTKFDCDDFESQLSNFIMGDLLYKTEKCALEVSKMLLVSPFIPPVPQSTNDDFQKDSQINDQIKQESGKFLNTQDIHLIISECMKSFQQELRCAMAEMSKSSNANPNNMVKPMSSTKGPAQADYDSSKPDFYNPNSSNMNNFINSPSSVKSAASTPKKSLEAGPKVDKSEFMEIKGKGTENPQLASEAFRNVENHMIETAVEKNLPQFPIPGAMLVKGSTVEEGNKSVYSIKPSQESKDAAESQQVVYRNIYYDPSSAKMESMPNKTVRPETAQAQKFYTQYSIGTKNLMSGPEAFNPNAYPVDQSWTSITNFNEKLIEATKAKFASFPRQQTFQGGNNPSNCLSEMSKIGNSFSRMENASNAAMASQALGSNAGQTRIRVKNFSEIPAPVKLPPYVQQMKVIQDPSFAINPTSHNPEYPGAFVDMLQLPSMNPQEMGMQQLPTNAMMNAFIATPHGYNGSTPQINSVQGNPANSVSQSWLPQYFQQNKFPFTLNQDQVMPMPMPMQLPHPPINRTEAQIFIPGQNKQTSVSRTPSADLWVPRWRANRSSTSDVPNECNDTLNDKNSLKSEGQSANPNSRRPKLSSPALCGIMGF